MDADIAVAVWECGGEVYLAPEAAPLMGEIGRRYRFMGTLRYRDGQAEVKCEPTEAESLAVMAHAIVPFVRYVAAKLDPLEKLYALPDSRDN